MARLESTATAALAVEPEADKDVRVAGVPAAQLVDAWCRVYWPEEDGWLDCQVREYSATTRTHRVLYERDLEDEWLDLRQEQRLGRLQLLPGGDPGAWPAPPPRPANPKALHPCIAPSPLLLTGTTSTDAFDPTL